MMYRANDHAKIAIGQLQQLGVGEVLSSERNPIEQTQGFMSSILRAASTTALAGAAGGITDNEVLHNRFCDSAAEGIVRLGASGSGGTSVSSRMALPQPTVTHATTIFRHRLGCEHQHHLMLLG